MSTALTLAQLRQEVGANLGEGVTTGTFTSGPSNQVQDNARYDPNNYWNGGYLQDTTVASGPIVRVSSWVQTNTTFNFFANLPGTCQVNDAYEVHKLLSFDELRRAINRGITLCGQNLRVLVRDESQLVQAGVYQYTVNYSAALASAFFPGGIVRIDIQADLGQPTAPWAEVSNWQYLDDYTVQLQYADVDAFAGNPIRFTGYGPIGAPVTTDVPGQVIATFQDDWMVEALAWACTYHAWLIAAGKKSANESKEELQMAQVALGEFQRNIKQWSRPALLKRTVIIPTLPGWSGSTRSS